jgi:hypothetical protein
MTKQINVKVMCACGEEVTERLNALDDTMILLAEAIETGSWQGIQNKVAQWLKYEEDRPTEPESGSRKKEKNTFI